MLLAVDVQYSGDSACVGGVLFDSWQSDTAQRCLLQPVMDVQPYEPGAFYKRELPCILSILKLLEDLPEIIVIDGFVTLGTDQRKGLGMHLYDALAGRASVVGVAKKAFKDTPSDCALYRGRSDKPLFVTSVGMPLEAAKEGVSSMAGKHRLPVLLKMADQLCRGIISP